MNCYHPNVLPHSNSTQPTFSESFRYLFYLISPEESRFKDVSSVPDYTAAASPAFFILIALECVIAKFKHKPTLRIKDGITSINAGINSRLIRLITSRSLEMTLYCYIYDNWRLVDLPWDSSLTWILSFLGMDFAYYWFHRASHEINILWIFHQTHHSSEDYNLTTALRQSAFQSYGSMFFFAFCGFIIPPSVHLVHLQINILFQFWIHTELVNSLGILEYVLNTPSHHRVHHGRNPYCIDKNYAGVLIIWDRLFGTFAEERKGEQIAYGLVYPINTFGTFYVQIGYAKNMLKEAWKMEGICNKILLFFKGPGWNPGRPRLMDKSELPKIEYPIVRYEGNSSTWVSVYVLVHVIAIIPIYDQLMQLRTMLSETVVILDVIFLLSTLTCMGFLFDNRSYAYHLECIRCFGCGLILHASNETMSFLHQIPLRIIYAIELLHFFSVMLWLAVVRIRRNNKKKNS